MNRLFEIEIIQPKFDNTYKEYEQKNKSAAFEKGKNGQLSGVSITSKNIVNNGEISSVGPGYRTEIISDDYKGKGKVEARNSSGKWWERTWVQIIMLLGAMAGIIGLVYLFLV